MHFFPIGPYLLIKFSLDVKVVGFQFWKKISPTLDHFQAIGVEKNVNRVFLKNDGAKQILFLTMLSHIIIIN